MFILSKVIFYLVYYIYPSSAFGTAIPNHTVRLSSNLNQFSMILFRIKNVICQCKSDNSYSNLDKLSVNEEFDADDEFKHDYDSDSAINNC